MLELYADCVGVPVATALHVLLASEASYLSGARIAVTGGKPIL